MSNFGATTCCDSAQQIERAGREQATELANDELPRLCELYQALCTELMSLDAQKF
jgi:hypothetical protein